MARAFNFSQAERVRRAFRKHKVQYLFLGKSGAILLGYSDTTQDVDLFVRKDPENNSRLVKALRALRFKLSSQMERDVLQGKDFIQLRNGPFDLDIIFAPDGIENFQEAWERHVTVFGYPVCHLDDIIRSKEHSGRIKDKESLPRLKAFREFWKKNS